MPTHAEGLLVAYGSQGLVEANAEYRGYDLSPYWQRCGVATMSPADLGKIIWLKVDGGEWLGPCLAVDVAAQVDFDRIVYKMHEVAEVPFWMAEMMGFENGGWGQVYIGDCSPGDGSVAQTYAPLKTEWQGEARPLFWPYPTQELPRDCSKILDEVKEMT